MASFARRLLYSVVVGIVLLTLILSPSRPTIIDRFIPDNGSGGLEEEWQWARDVSIVIPWVNVTDPTYPTEEAILLGEALAEQRDRQHFQSSEQLRYTLRSLDKYLPWHRGPIHIISPKGQAPSWLDASYSRIHLVSEMHIIPPESSPTSNEHLVSWYWDRIPELTEHFIFIGEGSFALSYTHPSTFFTSHRETRFYHGTHTENTFESESEQYSLTALKEAYADPSTTLPHPSDAAPLALRRSFFPPTRLVLSKQLRPLHDQKASSGVESLLPIPSVMDYALRLSHVYGEDSVSVSVLVNETSKLFWSAELPADAAGSTKLFRALKARSAAHFRFVRIKDVGGDHQEMAQFLEGRWPKTGQFEL